MSKIDDYQMKYWPTENIYLQNAPKKRSVKRKLGIIASFLFVLAVTPSIILSLSNFEASKAPEISVLNNAVKTQGQAQKTKTVRESHKVTIEVPKTNSSEVVVINNDSYWKISKRACGSGQYYLSIQAQNNSKPLFKGDLVIANCSL